MHCIMYALNNYIYNSKFISLEFNWSVQFSSTRRFYVEGTLDFAASRLCA